jgi:PTH2 family peptidyl-tRNA hydrolase
MTKFDLHLSHPLGAGGEERVRRDQELTARMNEEVMIDPPYIKTEPNMTFDLQAFEEEKSMHTLMEDYKEMKRLEKEMNGNLKTEYKHVILVREDLPMSMGKFGVQIHHASVKSMKRASAEAVKRWNEQCIKTILLAVPDAYELVDLDYQLDERDDIPNFLVIDLGVTEFGEPTITSMGIGPAESDKIDEFTSKYGLYKPNEEFLKENFQIDGEQVQDVMKFIEKKRGEAHAASKSKH